LVYDAKADNVVVPVSFDVEPERIKDWPVQPTSDLPVTLRDLIARGLRVRLESSSLITGEKQLNLDVFPNSPPAELRVEGNRYVIPALSSGGSDDLMAAASGIMAKLNSVPFEQIGDNLNTTLKALSDVANSDQLRQSLASLRSTLAGADTLVKRLNTDAGPALQRLPAIADQLEDSVRRANKVISSVDNGYGGNSTFNRDFDRMMVQITDTARALRVLADLLTRHPEALIRGRADQGP